ncbi:hypothetical protein V6N11_023782 [Hibiscus sabdariffa]|uniref:UDP-N-acetylmuramate dehydrogenase n=1 Tax=Hibiscus sabdariffa TaxID=183260 RepID=A0ABR2TN76_9ROSI
MASMTFPLVRSPTNSTSIVFHHKDQTQKWNGLKFVRGKKLLKDLCTWGIGGPCNYFVQVFHQTHLLSAIRYCHEFSVPYIVIGKGSNCLFDDLGFDGCVILNQIDFLERTEPGVYRVGSGFRFNQLGILSCNEGFAGLEFAAGIPGTAGGAAYMNAGANVEEAKKFRSFLKETADSIESIDIVTTEGKFRTLDRVDLSFGYRSSPFQDMNDLAAIVAVTFRLQGSVSARKRQQELLKRLRRSTQPVGERSAGSVFRNPKNSGVSAGELIEKAGLKGCCVGGAMVSNIHGNFFVNKGDCTSQDMLDLIALVKEKVESKFGVELEQEVLYFHPYGNIASSGKAETFFLPRGLAPPLSLRFLLFRFLKKMNHINLQQNVATVSAYEEMGGFISSISDHQKASPVVCPKPRRIRVLSNNPIRPFRLHMSHQADVSDSKASAELLDIILNKGDLWGEQPAAEAASPPPFFRGSPPSRATNPLVQDARFGDERFAALSALQVPSSSPSVHKGGRVRMSFDLKPAAIRIEGFDCLNRDSQNSRVPAMA